MKRVHWSFSRSAAFVSESEALDAAKRWRREQWPEGTEIRVFRRGIKAGGVGFAVWAVVVRKRQWPD